MEEKQSGEEEVGSCGCEEACSWCAAVSHTHTYVHKQIFFPKQTKNEELVYWLQLNQIRKERLSIPMKFQHFCSRCEFIYHAVVNAMQVNMCRVD